LALVQAEAAEIFYCDSTGLDPQKVGLFLGPILFCFLKKALKTMALGRRRRSTERKQRYTKITFILPNFRI